MTVFSLHNRSPITHRQSPIKKAGVDTPAVFLTLKQSLYIINIILLSVYMSLESPSHWFLLPCKAYNSRQPKYSLLIGEFNPPYIMAVS